MTYLGLRPGEKLYEELLVKTEELDKTENSMIFIERDSALSAEEIDDKLAMLKEHSFSCIHFNSFLISFIESS